MENIYKQAVAMQFKFRDYLDDGRHPVAKQLQTEIQRLVDEIEMKKNPRSLEDRLKSIIRQLAAADGTPVMSNHHVDDLRDRCEDLQQSLRKLQ